MEMRTSCGNSSDGLKSAMYMVGSFDLKFQTEIDVGYALMDSACAQDVDLCERGQLSNYYRICFEPLIACS